MALPGCSMTGKGPNPVEGFEEPTCTAVAWDPAPACGGKVTRRSSSKVMLPPHPNNVTPDGTERVNTPSQIFHVLTPSTTGVKLLILRIPPAMR